MAATKSAAKKKTTQIMAGDIAVHCAHSDIVPIGTLVPNPRNPNTHPDKQIAALAKIIRAQGWRQPIGVSTHSGFVVRGHGRLMAAQSLGVTHVPIDLQNYANDADEWADLVADNRIAELAKIDKDALADLLGELDDLHLELTGFDAKAIEQLLEGFTGEGGIDPIVSEFHILVECQDEAQQMRLLEQFMQEGLTCRSLTS